MTRYSAWPRWAARAVLAAVVVIVAFASVVSAPPPQRVASNGITDVKLYRAITADVSAGRPYYSAAAEEQRANGYPTAPPQVIRQPSLAYLLALLRTEFLRSAAVISLAGAIVLRLQTTLAKEGIGSAWRVATITSVMTGVSVVGTADAAYVHEIWAALLMLLSVIIYRSDRWAGSVVLGFIACLFRELAFPFLFAMGACALSEHRKKEFFGWLLCALLFLSVYAVHVHLAGLQHRPDDLRSQGWVYMGGLQFIVATARWNLLLHYCPSGIVALGASIALLGLVGSRDPRAIRSALIADGYMFAFAFVGRPDNYWWGILYAPFLALGFVLAPAALRDLFARAFGSPALQGARS